MLQMMPTHVLVRFARPTIGRTAAVVPELHRIFDIAPWAAPRGSAGLTNYAANVRASMHTGASNPVNPSVDAGRDLHVRVRLALERNGSWLVTCANVFQLSGFVCDDVLYLQSLMIIGNGSMALFFITRMPPLGVACAWATLKVLVNIMMVFKILHARRPIQLTTEELEAYEEHFMHFGVTARQFKKLWDLGETRTAGAKDLLSEEGKPVEMVSLVLSGYVFRTCGGLHISALDTFPGARYRPEGDAGAWVGELTALRMLDSVSKSSSVSQHKPSCADEPSSVSRDGDEEVQRLQRTLAGLSLYEGELDGVAGEQTTRALHKLEVTMGAELDGIDGPKTHQAREQLDQFLLERKNARWSTHAGEAVVVRCWALEPLLNLCASNAEMRGIVRKAFSQSAIKKAIALNPRPIGASSSPEHSGRADDDAIRRYESALRKVFGERQALPEDKVALSRFREQHRVSEAQHAAALKFALGWTPQEYEYGAALAHIGDARRSYAAQALEEEPRRGGSAAPDAA